VKSFLDAVRAGKAEQFKMGGTGLHQEDQVVTTAIEQAASVKFSYIAFRGGGEVAVQLANAVVDATVNNPMEAVAQWRAGKVRPLCVLARAKLPGTEKVAGGQSWNAIPTCVSQGLDVAYRTIRALFLPPDVGQEQIDFYLDLLAKARQTPEWNALMRDSALEQAFVAGKELDALLAGEEKAEEERVRAAGLLDKPETPGNSAQ
jgi:putative tricarboxylic transport membrane protein